MVIIIFHPLCLTTRHQCSLTKAQCVRRSKWAICPFLKQHIFRPNFRGIADSKIPIQLEQLPILFSLFHSFFIFVLRLLEISPCFVLLDFVDFPALGRLADPRLV